MTVTMRDPASVDVGDRLRLRLARFVLIDPRTGHRIATTTA
jgi:hypothetical protein